MIKSVTILLLSCFVVLALGDGFWNWPLERYETATCSSNNGTSFCRSCGIVVICILQGDNYTEISGTCPTTSPCFNGDCSPILGNENCTCNSEVGISNQCDAVNPQYYILCVNGEENFLKCPDGQEFDCDNSMVCMTPPSTTTTTTTTTVPPPPCTEIGVFPDGCTNFLVCTVVGQPPTRYNCSTGEFFDPNIKNCVPNEPFSCNTTSITGDYPDPYDCQRYYVCSGGTLVFTECCPDGQYYNSQPGISSCQPNNGECVNALECFPSAESSIFEIYRGFDKWKNYDSGSYFSL